MRLREIKNSEYLSEIKNLYVEAFPASERKPFDMITKKRDEGFCEILAIENDIGLFCSIARGAGRRNRFGSFGNAEREICR